MGYRGGLSFIACTEGRTQKKQVKQEKQNLVMARVEILKCESK